MARAIDSEAAYRFLSEQLVKGTGSFSKGVNKGLNIAGSAMRNPDAIPTLTPPNEPLTIEQLRQMEKPTPVWAKPEKKTIEAWDGYWCICHRGHIITPGMVSMYADKMNGVTFYAYPPTHIDLEAWEPCELCCRLGEVNPCYKDGCFKENVPKCDFRCDKFLDWRADTKKLAGAMFCPKCGRPLTPEARAMLEKRLRGCME